MHHIGIGAEHARTQVLKLVDGLHIRIVNAATGELLRELTIDPTRNYQPLGRPPGPKPENQKAGPQFGVRPVRDLLRDHMVELRGFEPLTFSLRTRRATNCATAPGPDRSPGEPSATQKIPPGAGAFRIRTAGRRARRRVASLRRSRGMRRGLGHQRAVGGVAPGARDAGLEQVDGADRAVRPRLGDVRRQRHRQRVPQRPGVGGRRRRRRAADRDDEVSSRPLTTASPCSLRGSTGSARCRRERGAGRPTDERDRGGATRGSAGVVSCAARRVASARCSRRTSTRASDQERHGHGRPGWPGPRAGAARRGGRRRRRRSATSSRHQQDAATARGGRARRPLALAGDAGASGAVTRPPGRRTVVGPVAVAAAVGRRGAAADPLASRRRRGAGADDETGLALGSRPRGGPAPACRRRTCRRHGSWRPRRGAAAPWG